MHVGHPFASAGGGTLFEYKVATLLCADLLRERLTEHGGVIEALALQQGPAGFDDIQISLDLAHGGHRVLNLQCRHRQPFTKANPKFAALVVEASMAVAADSVAFAAGDRRLGLIVDAGSPGHSSMTELCELARAHHNVETFERTVEVSGGQIASRWRHCHEALGQSPSDTHRLLTAIEVRAVEVDAVSSRDSVELINRLGEAWDPPNVTAAVQLGNALFKHLTEYGPKAGAIDVASLQRDLGSHVPALGAATRRSRLSRIRDAGHARVVMSLRALGLGDEEADAVAALALGRPPSIRAERTVTVVTGAMGVGKTMELERLHRQAIDRAFADRNAPIPLFHHARELQFRSLQDLASGAVEGLGDPSRNGVQLIIDGLDEAGTPPADIAVQAAALQAAWPNTTVIAASRPHDLRPAFALQTVAPLSDEEALDLMALIEPAVQGSTPRRDELTDVLRHPLFAIRYALNRRENDSSGTTAAQLVASVGKHALQDLEGSTDGDFQLLVRLATGIIESGGNPVELRRLGATPLQIHRLRRSRVLQVEAERASFQLAVLTEWFAAVYLLEDLDRVAKIASTPLSAHRWRYALVQALLQATATDVDRIMTGLLEIAPATAALVHHEATPPFRDRGATSPQETPLEAASRIRNAARAWLQPWPPLLAKLTIDGEMPTVGARFHGAELISAWRFDRSTPHEAVELPSDARPFSRDRGGWAWGQAGRPRGGVAWPWVWTRERLQGEIDSLLTKERALLADIELFWPELAWDYALRMINGNTIRAEPIPRDELEATITRVRKHAPEGEVFVGYRNIEWRLSEGEAFVADLRRLGIEAVNSPWPPADSSGGSTWHFWTTEQLLARLHVATKAALDGYQAIVETHLPSLAAGLDTYLVLPARLVGSLAPATPTGGWDSAGLSWYLEPLEAGSANEAHWSVGSSHSWFDETTWNARRQKLRGLRGDIGEYLHGPSEWSREGHILSTTPAGLFALSLLVWDLSRCHWTTRSMLSEDMTSIPPRFRG